MKIAFAMTIMTLASGTLFADPRIDHSPENPDLMTVELSTQDVARIGEHLDGVDSRLLTSENLEIVAAASANTAPGKRCWIPPADAKIPKLHWWNKLNPIWWIGNDEDPVPPDWYRPGEKFRKTLWYLRNPLHNFTNYVIGVKDLSNKRGWSRCGEYPEMVFSPQKGWNFSVIHYGMLRLPFVSYWNAHYKFYIGWRDRGNFGVKINRSSTTIAP